jgi:methionyl aminopeptidase
MKLHRLAIGTVRPGKISPMRPVPGSIERPDYAATGVPRRRKEPRVKSPDIIARMRRTGHFAAEVLYKTATAIAPGVTTDELDVIAHDMAIAGGAYPSPLNYNGFPKSICTSVNEVICHGIPDNRRLQSGDIVNLDITVYREGVHGDTNATFFVGQPSDTARHLVDVTHRCLELGIGAVRAGRPISDIGKAIEDHATTEGFGVVRTFVGHGIGEQFHTDLQIPHYYTPQARTIMEPGMVFTIEPMITVGSPREVVWDDGWTAVTEDRKLSAQFEHMILVTDSDAEILTAAS